MLLHFYLLFEIFIVFWNILWNFQNGRFFATEKHALLQGQKTRIGTSILTKWLL